MDKTDNSLYSVRFFTEGILKIINLMIKFMATMEFFRLYTIKNYLQDLFRKWKVSSGMGKAEIAPVYMKNYKQLMKNNRPFSLLSLCGKMFERILYISGFSFLNQNDLLSPA